MNAFERHPARTLVVLAALLSCVVLVADLAAGFLWRVGRQPLRVRSPWFHHGLAPLQRTTQTWGSESVPFFTNSLGLRDSAPRTVSLASPGRRMLIIGDSFTEGSGVGYEESFAGIIGAGLAPGGVEVLNAGVASYSGLCYWRKVRHLVEEVGLEVDEVVVFLDISDVYDSTTYALDADENVIKRRRLKRFQEFLESRTLLLGWLSGTASLQYQQRMHWTRGDAPQGGAGSGPLPSRGIGHHHALWTIDDAYYDEYGRSGLASETQALDRLAALATKHGLALTVVVYPWPDQIWHRDRDSRQVGHWRAWSEAHGVRFANLFPTFIPDTPGFDPAATIREYYIQDDVHWNRAGHALVGSSFLGWYGTTLARVEAASGGPGP
jgi:lysophospholipase L1-like esterase